MIKNVFWYPCKSLVWLGNNIDTAECIPKIPERRIEKLINSIKDIKLEYSKKRKVRVRKLASVVGQIISMYIVIGNIGQLMSRSISVDILKAVSWESCVTVSDDSKIQLQFWLDNIVTVNTRKLFYIPSCDKIVYSDASSYAFGGYCVETLHGIAHGMWNSEERSKSSTWIELVANQRVLKSLGHILAGKLIKWFTDNQNIVHIVNKGSMKGELQV